MELPHEGCNRNSFNLACRNFFKYAFFVPPKNEATNVLKDEIEAKAVAMQKRKKQNVCGLVIVEKHPPAPSI